MNTLGVVALQHLEANDGTTVVGDVFVAVNGVGVDIGIVGVELNGVEGLAALEI